MSRRFRIAISGPSGVGKTTLARALSDQLNLPLIEEGLGPVYAARDAFLRSQRDGVSTHEQQREKLAAWMQSFYDWTEHRARLYAKADGFVADRWEADHVSNWLRAMAQYRPDSMTAELLMRLDARAKDLDLAIIIAPSQQAVEQRNETGLQRNLDLTTATLSFSTTFGLLSQLELGRRLLPLAGHTSLASRVDSSVGALLRLG